jgi:thioredoxin-related protein
MNQQGDPSHSSETKRRKDKGKLVFLIIIAVAIALVYLSQQSGAELPDWPGDLTQALAQAKQEDRRVLVFFASKSPSANARQISRRTLTKSAKQIERGKFIKVFIQVRKTDELVKRYGIPDLPAFLILDPQGKELNRRIGFIGAAAFRTGFLYCTEVQKP